MKKFVVLLVVVAITCFSAMAFAADVTVGGSYEVRSRDFVNTATKADPSDSVASGDQKDTQTRIRIDVNAKAGEVKGKLQLESDFGTGSADWGTFEGYSVSSTTSVLGFREAWVNFNLPFAPINVTAGHQLLTLGNGWFFRSMHYGSDAWVVANQTGNNTAAFVDVKVSEGSVAKADDIDAYVILDVFKLSDAATVGVDLANLRDRRSALAFGGGAGEETNVSNLGINFNGKLGPVALKAELDKQFGKAKNATTGDVKFKGNQAVVQGAVGLDPVTVNFTLARGTGAKAGSTDHDAYVTFLDIDPHYTFLYEYKVKTAAGAKNTGFSNTTAFAVGASAAATKSLTVGADLWLLRATQAVALNGGTASRKVGTEIDVKVNYKIYDNLAWNWTLGLFKPGEAYDNGTVSSEDVKGIQGVLAFKF